ncbi:MAG: PEP-CTERM sorting domain-containing protein [Planctomycetales bacterium]|nr:PEP-CTERM sorting domain-containing protein [Planctomycetales bacterium]
MLRRVLSCCALLACVWNFAATAWGQGRAVVFSQAGVQFGGDPAWEPQTDVLRLDNGRVIERTMDLPFIPPNAKITTRINVIAAGDHWDRAGAIELVTPNGAVELHKFITGFGGTTQHTQDISQLAPYLRNGPVTVRAFVDTWVQEAWQISLMVQVQADAPDYGAMWNRSVFNDQDWRAGEFANDRRSHVVSIPTGLDKITLNYLASGHASDGSGGDEFVPRAHRIYIDGVKVFDETPWRTDGKDFRSVNPYSARWGDVWSSDLERSGWIPGDDVDPYQIDVTQYLAPGRHRIEYEIPGIEPDEGDGYGYWRVSSYLTGFESLAPTGDFTDDQRVDGLDFLAWQRGRGLDEQLALSHGDANRDGHVTRADLDAWEAQWGTTAALSSVPEPATISLFGIAVTATNFTLFRRRR